MTIPEHRPVLLGEVLTYLSPMPGMTVVDATVGLGGHSAAVLEATAPDGVVVAMDQDPDALAIARDRLASYGNRVRWHSGSFAMFGAALDAAGVGSVDGVLMDLGMSSYQLEHSKRGFSFLRDEPLDMRMNPETRETAADVVNRWSRDDLEWILRTYGEERWSRRIATGIVSARAQQPLSTTADLVRVIDRCVPRPRGNPRARIHPATRSFQALRIAVNDELSALEAGIDAALRRLKAGGVLCVIAFHSLEDRVVKHRLRGAAGVGVDAAEFELLTKKPVVASADEVASNPRARSAKLRAIRRLAV
ncbi:16S rRNA (cytosine(1402)-N(4))-methyltransferase RsmH [Candidatus Poribacteria bacterium]|nr:16S rRNA (cytosine(1402)-N(4))-methyltransferase RsmH [Candidatus Poribacteria bacterium]